MPIRFDFEHALFRWQAKHGEKMTYAELAKRAGISEPTIYRLSSAQPTKLDLDKLNRICKVLECQPGDLLPRIDTERESGLATPWRGQDIDETMEFIRQHTAKEQTSEDDSEA
jgi:putative transcriptional regulator